MDPVTEYLETLQMERGASRNTLAAYRRDLAGYAAFVARAGTRIEAAELARARALSGRAATPRPRRPQRGPAPVGRARPLPFSSVERARSAAIPPSTSTARGPPVACPAHCPSGTLRPSSRRPTRRGPTDCATARCSSSCTRSGLRASEAIALRVDDVNLEGGYVMATGKGSRQRLVPMGAQAVAWIRRYLDAGRARLVKRGAPAALFLNRSGGALSRQAVWQLAEEVGAPGRRAGRRRVSPHAAPLLREPLARGRGRPALGAGHARTRRHLDDADLHAPVVERGARHVPGVSPARAEGGLIRGEGGRRLSAGGAARGGPGRPARRRGPAARPGRARARGVPARGRPRARAGAAPRGARGRSGARRVAGARRAARRRLGVVRAARSSTRRRPRSRRGGSSRPARRMVLVREGRRVVGVIERDRAGVDGAGMSLAARLDHLQSRADEARLWLLRAAGKIGESMGTPVHAVGGFVRDLMLGRVAPDIDLVVEGDGIAFARRLCRGDGWHADRARGIRDGVDRGRDDRGGRAVAARGRRLIPPGALCAAGSPARREPGRPGRGSRAAGLHDQRDGAGPGAVELRPSGATRCGGRHDVRRRVLRPLHPLSFVEDPTRLFRAARYAARLGARFGPDGRAALALALRIGDYPALSGQRLRAEIDLLAAESIRPTGAFDRALRWQLLRLWDRRFRVAAARARAPPRGQAL